MKQAIFSPAVTSHRSDQRAVGARHRATWGVVADVSGYDHDAVALVAGDGTRHPQADRGQAIEPRRHAH